MKAMPLYLRSLGTPGIRSGDAWLERPPDWPLLLLAFVAGFESGVSRAEVVACFWPEEDERAARHNLSQLLYRYRTKPWAAALEAEPARLRWCGESDLRLFRQAVAEGGWHRAAGLYGGEFLSGVRADHAAAVSDWLQAERSALASEWRASCLELAADLRAQGKSGEAAAVLAPVLQQDLLAEDVLQAYMACSAESGRRDAALLAFDRFRTQLAGELDLEPLPATQELAEGIRSQQSAPAPVEIHGDGLPSLPPAPAAERAALGLQLTPFIGRDIELAEIAAALRDPALRLLTLVGPGGTGKSRLARQVVQEHAGSFAGGAAFVPLAPLGSAGQIVPAIAAAMELQGSGPESPMEQLVQALAGTDALLVLDNMEHLPAGANIVAELLEACPDLKVLATSREPLGFAGEVLLDLAGLGYPEQDDDPFALVYDSVQLFVRSARRVHSGFALKDGDHSAVVRICRMLRGLPLGLELAAAWMRLLTPAELADELERNLDILESGHRGLPERHRSLRAVFDHSWALLSEKERTGLGRLAVFRGGFDKAAAQGAAGLSLRTLLTLVNRSLVVRTESGRFELLEVVRQYAAEKLAGDAAEALRTEQAHAHYYLERAEAADAELTGPAQAAWLERLAQDHDNLRAALDWATGKGDPALGLRLANAQYWYWHIRGHYHEGSDLYDRLLALPGAADDRVLYARALYCRGSLASSLQDFDASRALTEASLDLYRAMGDASGTAQALWQLGIAARDSGALDEAGTLLEEARRLQEEAGDSFNLSTTYNDLAILAAFREQMDEAQALFEKSLALKRHHGDKQGVAYALGNLATLADARGEDPAVVRAALEESLALKRELADRRGIVTALVNLATVALHANDFSEAWRCLAEGLQLTGALGDRGRTLALGATAAHVARAQARFGQSATIAAAASALSERCGTPLPPHTRASLSTSLQEARACLDEAAFEAAVGRGRELELAELVAYLEEAASTEQPAQT